MTRGMLSDAISVTCFTLDVLALTWAGVSHLRARRRDDTPHDERATALSTRDRTTNRRREPGT